MSLGRPDRGSVDDKDRLFQILTGLYDAINGTRTSITQLEQRIVTVTDASTTINVGASSVAVSPLGFDREDGDGADGGPPPGSTSSTNMARVWVSTPDTAFPNGVNMGALGDGTLQQTVTAGVATPTVFAGTTGSIPFYTSGSQLAQDNTELFWNNSTKQLLLNTSTPFTQAAVEVTRNVNAGAAFTFVNESAGASAYTAFFLAQSQNLSSGSTFGTFLFSSGSTFGVPYGAGNGVFELAAGTGNMNFWIQQNSGDFGWFSSITFPNPPERMRLAWGGLLSVDPGGLLTSGTSQSIGTTTSHNDWITNATRSRNGGVYHTISNTSGGTTASGGYLVTQSSSGYGTNMVYLLLQSTGYATVGPYTANSAILEHVTNTATAPLIFSAAGPQNIDFYTTAGYARRLTINNGGTVEVVTQLHIDVSADQVWRNLGAVGAGTFEQVRAFWSGNVFNLKSETTGGTVRSMLFDAGTATATVQGNVVTLIGTTGIAIGSTPALTGSITMVAGSTITMTAGTAGTAPHPAANFSSSQLVIDTSIPVGVAGSATTWDGLLVTGGVSLTGGGTTLAYNSTRFAAPSITGTGVGGTVNESATVFIAGATTASAISINYKYAFWVDADISRFDGTVEQSLGANISSANNMTMGTDGNTFTVTGATQINTLAFSTGQAFRAGTIVHFIFASNPTVKHKTAGTGNQFDLSGDVDYATAAGATLTVVFDGTYWKELGRAAA